MWNTFLRSSSRRSRFIVVDRRRNRGKTRRLECRILVNVVLKSLNARDLNLSSKPTFSDAIEPRGLAGGGGRHFLRAVPAYVVA